MRGTKRCQQRLDLHPIAAAAGSRRPPPPPPPHPPTPGDHVVASFPGYQSLYSIAEGMGCSVTRWEARCGEGAALAFDFDELEVGSGALCPALLPCCPAVLLVAGEACGAAAWLQDAPA
jgi:hypothetical protein